MIDQAIDRRGFATVLAGATGAVLGLVGAAPTLGQERDVLGEFTGRSTGGYVGFFRESREAAMNNGTQIPASEDAEEAFTLDGVLYDDGTWESPDPQLPTLDATRTTFDPEILDGLSGEFDEEEGFMTAEGRIRVADAQDRSVEFDLAATTGESGELTGNFELDGTTVVATLVDNEYEIDNVENFGGGAIPDDDPDLSNYLEIGFEFEPDDELVQALLSDEEEDEDGGEEASDDSPGFGILAGLAGLGGVGYAIRRLQREGRQD